MSTRFDEAVQTVITGDAAALKKLLQEDPGLIKARAPSEHRSTLLHYVGANGIEDELQKTPPNAVEIARILLEAGAEVDALAETYGGGTNQTTLCLLVSSCHPAEAGLQPAAGAGEGPVRCRSGRERCGRLTARRWRPP